MIIFVLIVLIILLSITAVLLGYNLGQKKELVEKIQDMKSTIYNLRRKKK